MSEIAFLYFLSSDRTDRLRVAAQKEKDRILSFVVQYEAEVEGKWYAVVRYDTSHGFAHKDVMHPDGSEDKQPIYFPDQNIAFTYAIQDIKMLWRWYREGFEREMQDD